MDVVSKQYLEAQQNQRENQSKSKDHMEKIFSQFVNQRVYLDKPKSTLSVSKHAVDVTSKLRGQRKNSINNYLLNTNTSPTKRFNDLVSDTKSVLNARGSRIEEELSNYNGGKPKSQTKSRLDPLRIHTLQRV